MDAGEKFEFTVTRHLKDAHNSETTMIKKVLVTLLVTVDTEDEEICPSGDPLSENVVVNVLEDGFFMDPVEEIYTSHVSDYVDHSKSVQLRIENLYHD